MNKLIATAIGSVLILLLPTIAQAGSATWKRNPRSGDWNTKTNWRPATVPDGSSDTAKFELSNTTNISFSANTDVNSITFTPVASAYSITVNPNLTLTITGIGIVNNSGMAEKFITAVDGSGNFGHIVFINSATAGTSAFINNGSIFGSQGGSTEFYNSSSAGNADFSNRRGSGTGTSATVFHDTSTAANGTFTNDGGGSGGSPFSEGGQTLFFDNTTAANGTFTNGGATVNGAFGGDTVFSDSSTAGNGVFINKGGAASGVAALGGGATFFLNTSTAANGRFTNNAAPARGAEGGVTEFGLDFLNFSPSAGNGTFINNGATISGAVGGKTIFKNASTADAAALIANGGKNGGGGGGIFFEEKSTGGTSRVEIFGNGFLDISGHLDHADLTIGSIEGDGNAFLGSNNLTVGSNNMSTVFSGVLQDGGQNDRTGGSLTKIGSGTLDLTGANTYIGNTTIAGGVLKVDGSLTGNTFVHSGGTLAGTGAVDGAVTGHGTVTPGDALGTLMVNSYMQPMESGKLLIDIAGSSPGESSVLNVLGNVNVGGFLDPVLLNGFIPSIGDEFTFLNYGSRSGTFRIQNGGIFDNGMERWIVTYQANEAILTATKNVPDTGSTLPLLMLSLFGLVGIQATLRRS